MSHLVRRFSVCVSILMMVAACALTSTDFCKNTYAEEAAPTFQDVASSIYGQAVGDDDDGTNYVFGLTARYSGPDRTLPGEGKFKNIFYYLPVTAMYYNPEDYYVSTQKVEGVFKTEECVLCHTIQTPRIVIDWKASKHSKGGKTDAMDKEQVVGCDACHGTNHQELRMPSHNTCGKCHTKEHGEHLAGGQGSHKPTTIWDVSVTEFAWQIGKPGEEVAGCAQCHGIAGNRCDGCHTRHQFKPSEARKPDTCGICHMGVDHAEYEFWYNSYHGKIYMMEGDTYDWDKKLTPQNYRVPTCAYCHMGEDGNHNVQNMSTEYAHMGMYQLNRGAPKHKAKRDAWIKKCQGCHSPRWAAEQLYAMDEQINISFTKWREAVNIIVGLYLEGLLDPMPADLAPDWTGGHTMNLLPGGAPRFYNVSDIERMAVEMVVYQITAVYKAAAHFSIDDVTYNAGAFPMDRQLVMIKSEASKLRRIATLEKEVGIEHKAYDFWAHGEYTDLLTGYKRKEGDYDENDPGAAGAEGGHH
ncbi:MAG: multiheme c-type cytochrome [Planctomycetota bacterium]